MSQLPPTPFPRVETTTREPSSARWWEEIAAHCERFLGRPPGGLGEIVQGDPPITLFEHPSSLRRPRMTLRTSGVSERALAVPKSMDDHRYTELLLYLPPSWQLTDDTSPREDTWWPAALLKHLGRFIHEQQTYFEPGHSVALAEPGETYAPGTLVAGALLLPPSLEAPEFDRLSIRGIPCRFLWVHPITEAEMKLKLERGTDALIELMNTRGLSPAIDPRRACLLTGRTPSAPRQRRRTTFRRGERASSTRMEGRPGRPPLH